MSLANTAIKIPPSPETEADQTGLSTAGKE
jgi:hypothetical protein